MLGQTSNFSMQRYMDNNFMLHNLVDSILNVKKQHTLGEVIEFSGIALHGGGNVNLRILPADIDHGVVFQRIDVSRNTSLIPATWDMVNDTVLSTTIKNSNGISVSTIEHLMAALSGSCLLYTSDAADE